MATREEIMEGIAIKIHTVERVLAKVMHEVSPINASWEELGEPWRVLYRQQAVGFLSYLHSQGVVIKVDRELPKEVMCGQEAYAQKDIERFLSESGYVAVEPLIKED